MYMVVGTNVYVMYSMCTRTCIHGYVSEHVGTDEWLCLCLSAVPDPPVSLSVVNFGTRVLKATWLPPSEVFDDVAAVRYRITASVDNVPSQTMETPASPREQVISGLEPGTMYTVQVCCGSKTLPPTVCACVCVCVCMHVYLHVCLQECLHTFIHMCLHSCMHAYV